MNRWYKLLTIVLSFFLAIPCSTLSAIAAKATTKITHKTPEYYIPGFRVIFEAEIEDEVDVLVARCYFKTKKDKNFIFVDMVPKGNPGYQATLPAPWVNSQEIDYLFVVVNKDKKVVRTQLFTIEEKETEQAAQWKEAGEVEEIRVDQAQETVEAYEATRKELKKDHEDNLPVWQPVWIAEQIEVSTELEKSAVPLKGFYDNIVITEVPSSEKYGLLAEDIYSDSQIASAGGVAAIGKTTRATSAGQVKASSGGKSRAPIWAAAIGATVLGLAIGAGAGGGGGNGGDNSVPEDVTGTWNFQIQCQGGPTIASLDIPFNQTAGGDFTGSGTGTDYNGDTLSFAISGNFNTSSNLLGGQITMTNLSVPADPDRIDLFNTTLTSNSTGWIPTNCVQFCNCPAEVQLTKL